MYFSPGLRAFSEPFLLPSHCPAFNLLFVQKFQERFSWNHIPVSAPAGRSRRLHLPCCRSEPSHANLMWRIESWRLVRTFCSPPLLRPPAGWTMSSPANEVAGSVQMSPSAENPVLADESEITLVEAAPEDVIVQYIVIRKDLVIGLNWPLGSVISQGCHAAVAAVWLHRDDPLTLQYCARENLDNMHKVTLEVKGEAQLRTLAQKLESGGIVHKLWVEQPENYATCLATKPYYKSQVSSYFKKLKLCK